VRLPPEARDSRDPRITTQTRVMFLSKIGGTVKKTLFLSLFMLASCNASNEPVDVAQTNPRIGAALQCAKDTDCKGDRICESGACMSPTASPAAVSSEVFEAAPATSSQATPTPVSSAGNPKFNDYPAPALYTGPAAKLLLDSEFAREYRTRLKEALLDDPVFAGEYVSTGWGCGTQCYINAFVNKRTGVAVEETFGGESGPYIDTVKIDSSLLVAQGPVHDKDYNQVGYAAFFYALEDGQLKLIKQVEIPEPVEDEDGT
jgi:hypothetical protein